MSLVLYEQVLPQITTVSKHSHTELLALVQTIHTNVVFGKNTFIIFVCSLV